MAASFSARADDVFRMGPETLVAEASAIIAGPVSSYRRLVTDTSTPPESVPVRWQATGHVSDPRVLKGSPRAGFVEFSRAEQAMMLPPDGSQLSWEELYGDVQPDGQLVVFFLSDDPEPLTRVVPSGEGEQDLIDLVANAVRIQALEAQDQRIDGWLEYLERSRSTEGRKAALRSLIRESIEWNRLEPVVQRIGEDPGYGTDLRGFVFALTAFQVTREGWPDDEERHAAVDFLLRTFAQETDGELVLGYLDHLGAILEWTDDEDFSEARRSVRQRILRVLEGRPALRISEAGPVDAEMEQDYREVVQELLNR